MKYVPQTIRTSDNTDFRWKYAPPKRGTSGNTYTVRYFLRPVFFEVRTSFWGPYFREVLIFARSVFPQIRILWGRYFLFEDTKTKQKNTYANVLVPFDIKREFKLNFGKPPAFFEFFLRFFLLRTMTHEIYARCHCFVNVWLICWAQKIR